VAAEREDETMATITTETATAGTTTSTRRWNRAVWAVQILLGVFFVTVALPKLGGQKAAVDDFAKLGIGQWFRYLTALCELSGGIGLMVPRLSAAAASGLVGVMIGATIVNLLVLGPAIAPVTIALGVIFFFVARYRWNERHSLAAAVVNRIR
jgi:uncharacterized membrane protein YphA (DoxX/SURF4 family)